jgi:hypothetical protein
MGEVGGVDICVLLSNQKSCFYTFKGEPLTLAMLKAVLRSSRRDSSSVAAQ